MTVILTAWIGYMTTAYLSGNISSLTKPLGSLGSNIDQNVSSRLSGSPAHAAIGHIRIYTTAAIWVLAAAGLARRRLAGRYDTALIVLGAAPFVLVVLQPYGGEMLLRVFLFTLPAVAFFTASLVLDTGFTRDRRWGIAGIAVLGCLLLSVFQYTRYGNERLESFSTGDVAAVHALYRLAPHGSALYSGSYNLPWRYRNYADYDYHFIADGDAWQRNPDDSKGVIREVRIASGAKGAYVIVTRSTEIGAELLSNAPGSLQRLVAGLRASPAARQLYHSADGDIFFLRGTA
jgi:hypothetical protein